MEPIQDHIDSKSEVSKARKQVLDLLQATMGHSPQWKFVRSRILKIFGRDGLEKIVNGQEHCGQCKCGKGAENGTDNKFIK